MLQLQSGTAALAGSPRGGVQQPLALRRAQDTRRRGRSGHRCFCQRAASTTQQQSQAHTSAVDAVVAAHAEDQPASLPSSAHQPAIQQHWWPWRWGSRIRYATAGDPAHPPLLLVHGFGVGGWHYERVMPRLAASFHVYAVDLLGQGASWPGDPPHDSTDGWASSPDGPLWYSVDTWTRQLAEFCDAVIGPDRPTYVAGNSLGGLLAVCLAAQAQGAQRVAGLVLLNATPFWSARPPLDQPQGPFWGALRCDGDAPVRAPSWLLSSIQRLWWDSLRQPDTVASMLRMVTAHKPAVDADPALTARILEATEQRGALDAFLSVVLSPRPSGGTFDDMLRRLRCPVALVYGRQDPWVVPMWGQRALYVLQQHQQVQQAAAASSGSGASDAPAPPCTTALYLEIDGAGHCPHHEAPAATTVAMQAALQYMMGKGKEGEWDAPFAVGQRVPVEEEHLEELQDGARRRTRQVVIERVDGRPRILPEYIWHGVWRTLDAVASGRVAVASQTSTSSAPVRPPA